MSPKHHYFLKIASAGFFAVLLTSATLACGGGGGGGGGENNPAEAKVKVSPNRIDTGDRMRPTIDISNAREAAFAVKIRIPVGLEYVLKTASVKTGDNTAAKSPTDNEATTEFVYLVFYFTTADFIERDRLELSFELVGKVAVEDGKIEVDVDLDDPAVKNSSEFDPEAPLFTAQADAGIKVEG